MTLTRYILVEPDGTELPGEYIHLADASDVARILNCSVRIRHYDRRPDRAELLAALGFVVFVVFVLLVF